MTPGIEFEITCNACPVQIEGTIDGVPFYFRARGQYWAMGVGGEKPVRVAMGWEEGWSRSEPWGDGPFAAGWMPHETAFEIVHQVAAEFRSENGAKR